MLSGWRLFLFCVRVVEKDQRSLLRLIKTGRNRRREIFTTRCVFGGANQCHVSPFYGLVNTAISLKIVNHRGTEETRKEKEKRKTSWKHRTVSLPFPNETKKWKEKIPGTLMRNRLYGWSCGTSGYSLVSVSCVTARHIYYNQCFSISSLMIWTESSKLRREFEEVSPPSPSPRGGNWLEEVVTTCLPVYTNFCRKCQFHESSCCGSYDLRRNARLSNNAFT